MAEARRVLDDRKEYVKVTLLHDRYHSLRGDACFAHPLIIMEEMGLFVPPAPDRARRKDIVKKEDMYMKINLCLASILIVAIVVLSPFCVRAQGGPEGGRPPGPPPEMVEACQGKSTGNSCEFVGRQGATVSGTCQASREDASQLICLPKDRPKGGPGGQ